MASPPYANYVATPSEGARAYSQLTSLGFTPAHALGVVQGNVAVGRMSTYDLQDATELARRDSCRTVPKQASDEQVVLDFKQALAEVRALRSART